MITTVIGLKMESSTFVRIMTNADDDPGETRIFSLSPEKCIEIY